MESNEKETNNLELCDICSNEEKLCELNCGHKMCINCYINVKFPKTCPYCREPIENIKCNNKNITIETLLEEYFSGWTKNIYEIENRKIITFTIKTTNKLDIDLNDFENKFPELTFTIRENKFGSSVQYQVYIKRKK
jgi:hypothetical protein